MKMELKQRIYDISGKIYTKNSDKNIKMLNQKYLITPHDKASPLNPRIKENHILYTISEPIKSIQNLIEIQKSIYNPDTTSYIHHIRLANAPYETSKKQLEGIIIELNNSKYRAEELNKHLEILSQYHLILPRKIYMQKAKEIGAHLTDLKVSHKIEM